MLNNIFDFLFPDIIDFLPLIISGLGITIMLALIISICGLIGGVILLYFSISSNRKIALFCKSYISFFIGTPLLVILFLVYYGLPQYGFSPSVFTVSVICFTLNISAYNASYLLTPYRGLDKQELDAATIQGFTNIQVYYLMILPQVFRNSIPSLTNQVINNIKDTSIVFLIGYTDFFARMQEIASYNFRFFMVYIITAVTYLVLALVVVKLARYFERSCQVY